MKLIRILALATAMAAVATAQNPGSAGGGKSPSPTPTPAKQAAKPAATKTSAGTAAPVGAKANPPQSAASPQASGNKTGVGSKNPIASGKATPATGKNPAKTGINKPPVASGTLNTKGTPIKTAQGATSSAATKAGAKPNAQTVPQKTGLQQATAVKNHGVAAQPSKTGSANIPAKAMVDKTGNAKSAKGSAANTKSANAKTTAVKATGATAKSAAKSGPAKAAAGAPETAQKEAPKRWNAAGRRDPFVSPLRVGGASRGPVNCTTGKRCLSIPELVLQGTVRDISGKMLAVVVTGSRRTYTLRENDQVYNGSVEKITTDSIIFREFVKDLLGRETAREVVKKMGTPTS
jgi:hypothetical protein